MLVPPKEESNVSVVVVVGFVVEVCKGGEPVVRFELRAELNKTEG